MLTMFAIFALTASVAAWVVVAMVAAAVLALGVAEARSIRPPGQPREH